MREIRLSGSEGGGANPIDSPYPYQPTVQLAIPAVSAFLGDLGVESS